MADRIDALAQRVAGDPFFLASALARFARSEGMDTQALARQLGCKERQLSGLALCRRPLSRDESFWRDIERIAGRFGLQKEMVAEVVRRAEALEAWDEQAAGEGWLQAARDRDETDRGSE